VLLVDVGIAIVAAIVVLTLTPGLAVASMIAIGVLTACAISFRRESDRSAAHRPVPSTGRSTIPRAQQ
jgi:hypothetical protein